MAVAVKMPQMGESVVEGTVARWLKAPGDTVERLEPLLEISTDKIDTEVPAPAAGAGCVTGCGVAAGAACRAATCARISFLVMRPPKPVPMSCSRSTACSAAMRATTGLI